MFSKLRKYIHVQQATYVYSCIYMSSVINVCICMYMFCVQRGTEAVYIHVYMYNVCTYMYCVQRETEEEVV